MITGDFETRSAVNLLKAGAWRYSIDPSTKVMCFCWAFEEDPIENVYAWQSGWPELGIEQSPFPTELAERVRRGDVLEAHNAFFEWCIWNHVWRLELPDLPELPLSQIKCSAAKAAAFALPRALDNAIEALGLPQKKDKEGSAIMLKLCKPRKLTVEEKRQYKADGIDPETVIVFHEDKDDILRNTVYCQQDVRAERGLSSVLRDLTPEEHEFWQMDLRMNARGITCDLALVHIALDLAVIDTDRQNAELCDLTDGFVQKATGRIKFKKWCHDNGVKIPNTQGAVIDILLGHDHDDEEATAELKAELQGIILTPKVRRAMEIVRDVNRSSISKYRQMLLQVSDENRLRDMMLYCGASRTRRWSGKGVQPHNFIRGYSGEVMDEVCRDIMKADEEILRMLYNGSVLEVLSKATRGALIAAPGKKLMVGDFAAIEARVLPWLAGATEALQVFFRGDDIYLDMATSIFGYPCLDKSFEFERRVGKAAILGLGFQMGWEKFEDECRNKNGITDQEPAFFKRVVDIYRKEQYPEVSSFWYDFEEAAIEAVRRYDPKTMSKGPVIECRDQLSWFMWGQFLHMRLPSGGLLSYFRPLLKKSLTYQFEALNERGHNCHIMVKGGSRMTAAQARRKAMGMAKIANKTLVPNKDPNVFDKVALTFMHENSKTRQWERKQTYGGELVENATQATARDLMAEAMLRIDKTEVYDLLLSVHDEAIAECDEDKGDQKEFENLLSIVPAWAEGCPIDSEVWEGHRYRK